VTQANNDPKNCVARIYYDYYGELYPDVKFSCKCGTEVEKILKYSDNGLKLSLVGTLTTRFILDDFYNTVDLDPV
jgi:hypothetical protein